MFLILVLFVVALYPSLPENTAILVENLAVQSGLFDSAKSFIHERFGGQSEADTNARTRAEEAVKPNSAGNVGFYITLLDEADLLLVADQGNHLAQHRVLKSAGVNLSDLDGYLQTLYEHHSE